MFKLLGLKWKKEFEQLKSIHEIELKKKDSELQIRINEADKNAEIKLRETISLLKLDSEQKIKQMEIDHKRDLAKVEEESAKYLVKQKEALLEDHHLRLSNAMTKLHEEGNITTRFTQDLALKMMESMPTHKLQTKLITSAEGDKSDS